SYLPPPSSPSSSLSPPATAPTSTSTLSLHDALPISSLRVHPFGAEDVRHPVRGEHQDHPDHTLDQADRGGDAPVPTEHAVVVDRSEEHTSELQSRENLVCRLLLEKQNKPTPDTRDDP